jgi:glycosyltransferase involved in cell wall biosynthesis
LPITAVILTFNEETNLGRALSSLHGRVERIVVVDSYSTDRTVDMATQYGCDILQHAFVNQAAQLNWGLAAAGITTPWVMRLDADERVTPELWEALTLTLPALAGDTSGIYVRRQVHFLGRWIRHGGYYPTWLLRVWRAGRGSCEERRVDEHVRLTGGKTLHVAADIIDDNQKPLTWWIAKHNDYATREAIEVVSRAENLSAPDSIPARFWGAQDQRKRWLKERLYSRAPLFIRAAVYFLGRYILRLGFLDGVSGLVWHVLQGFWYRFLVDAKIYEIRRKSRQEGLTTKEAIESLHGLKV